jgi:single-stranded DNA-specific DHH superfamily exonuclease
MVKSYKAAYNRDFRKFVSAIRKRDRVAVVYHPDADGFSSAFIISEALKRLRGKRPELIFCQRRRHVEIVGRTVKKLKDAKINYLITVDLCVDQKPENIRKVEKFAKILVIDHHKVYEDLSSENTVFIKAAGISAKDGSRYPASKLSYDLFSRVVDIRDIAWVAAVGIMGDKAEVVWKGFIRTAIKRAGINMEKLLKIKRCIDAFEALSTEGFRELMIEFKKAKTPEALLSNKCIKCSGVLEEKISKLVAEAEQKAELYPEIELMFFRFSDRLNMKSALVNELSRMHGKRTIVVVEDKGSAYLGISARRGDFRVKTNELLEKATAGLKGATGGGHIPAAGGRIRRKDFAAFRKNVLRILKEVR